jgi:predicted N-acyltransferase
VVDDVGADLDAYLAELRGSARSVVRRDLRAFDRSGLSVERVPADRVLTEAAPLIAAIKEAHGTPEPVVLLEFRLREWALRASAHTAYVVRDGTAPVGISLGAVVGHTLEMYEVGMVADHPARHIAYLQVLLYLPLAHARELGLRRLALGFGAEQPKLLRGARAATTTHVLYRRSAHVGER